MKVTEYKVMKNEDGVNCLVKENCSYVASVDTINDYEKVVCLMNGMFRAKDLAEEHVWMIATNAKLKVIGVFEVAHGHVNGCMVSPREIFVRACLCGAACIVIAHNHPSGITTPTRDDELVTQRVAEAGKMIGIPLMDHVIIGEGIPYSFLNEGNVHLVNAK